MYGNYWQPYGGAAHSQNTTVQGKKIYIEQDATVWGSLVRENPYALEEATARAVLKIKTTTHTVHGHGGSGDSPSKEEGNSNIPWWSSVDLVLIQRRNCWQVTQNCRRSLPQIASLLRSSETQSTTMMEPTCMVEFGQLRIMSGSGDGCRILQGHKTSTICCEERLHTVFLHSIMQSGLEQEIRSGTPSNLSVFWPAFYENCI